MAASSRRGSSLAKPSSALQFVCSNPRTSIVKWSWSITQPDVSGWSHNAQRPPCSPSIAANLLRVRPNLLRRDSKSRSTVFGELRSRAKSSKVPFGLALVPGFRPAPGLLPPLGISAIYHRRSGTSFWRRARSSASKPTHDSTRSIVARARVCRG